MNTTNSQHCANCKKMIDSAKFDLHEAFCIRNNVICEKCGEAVDKRELQDHNEELHKFQDCPYCQVKFEIPKFEGHKNSCPEKPKSCQYCELPIKPSDYTSHMYSCGSRTRVCEICRRNIKIREYETHYDNCTDIPDDMSPTKESTISSRGFPNLPSPVRSDMISPLPSPPMLYSNTNSSRPPSIQTAPLDRKNPQAHVFTYPSPLISPIKVPTTTQQSVIRPQVVPNYVSQNLASPDKKSIIPQPVQQAPSNHFEQKHQSNIGVGMNAQPTMKKPTSVNPSPTLPSPARGVASNNHGGNVLTTKNMQVLGTPVPVTMPTKGMSPMLQGGHFFANQQNQPMIPKPPQRS